MRFVQPLKRNNFTFSMLQLPVAVYGKVMRLFDGNQTMRRFGCGILPRTVATGDHMRATAQHRIRSQ